MRQVITKTLAENQLLSLPIPFIPPRFHLPTHLCPSLVQLGLNLPEQNAQSVAAQWRRVCSDDSAPGGCVCLGRIDTGGVCVSTPLCGRPTSEDTSQTPNFQTHTYTHNHT